MIDKVTVFLVFLTFAEAGTIGSLFSPASIGSSSSVKYSLNTKARATPAPIYETEDTDRDVSVSRASEQGLFKPSDTRFAISGKYDSRITDNVASALHSSATVYSPSVGKPVSYYPSHPSPLFSGAQSGPVTYTTHTHSSPLVDNAFAIPQIKTLPISGYNKEIPIVHNVGNKIIYDAPSVSHVSFEGLGTVYKW